MAYQIRTHALLTAGLDDDGVELGQCRGAASLEPDGQQLCRQRRGDAWLQREDHRSSSSISAAG